MQKTELKSLVRRATRAWAKVYAAEQNGDALVRSLLRGAEFRILERLGELTDVDRSALQNGTISRAFETGRECVESIVQRKDFSPLTNRLGRASV